MNHFCSDQIVAESAGLEPGQLNPMVVAVMREEGIDISDKTTQSVEDRLAQGTLYDYIVTVCDEANAERCPRFPGGGERLHWGFPDPSSLQGSEEEKLTGTRQIRDAIKQRVKDWCRLEG